MTQKGAASGFLDSAASTFLARFPDKCVATPSALVEEAFRARLEAQHGWQFDHSWPAPHERVEHATA